MSFRKACSIYFYHMKPILFFSLILLFVTACSSTQSISSPTQAGFSDSESRLIMQADTNTPMRVFLITNYQDSILLRKPSKPVQPNPKDEALGHFVKRLYRTVTDSASLGVGIAAPQVGLLRQIIWVQRFDKPGFPFEVYLNPVIRQYTDKKQPCREGCFPSPTAWIPPKTGPTPSYWSTIASMVPTISKWSKTLPP
jgi:peptide deformylase